MKLIAVTSPTAGPNTKASLLASKLVTMSRLPTENSRVRHADVADMIHARAGRDVVAVIAAGHCRRAAGVGDGNRVGEARAGDRLDVLDDDVVEQAGLAEQRQAVITSGAEIERRRVDLHVEQIDVLVHGVGCADDRQIAAGHRDIEV